MAHSANEKFGVINGEKQKRGEIEKFILAKGSRFVGVDEVGRGCIAGPVYAACVILDFAKLLSLKAPKRRLLRDSKTLSHAQRQRALEIIRDVAIEAHIGHADTREIEAIGIQPATCLAMNRALQMCQTPFNIVLVDGNRPIKDNRHEQLMIIKGDHACFSIASASIVAKEARDEFMRGEGARFPGYGFENHVGYSTKEHLDAVARLGICELHRRNFAPISQMVAIPIPTAPQYEIRPA